MTVSTASNNYAKKQLQNQIRNYKKLDKEETAIREGSNQAKRKHTINSQYCYYSISKELQGKA